MAIPTRFERVTYRLGKPVLLDPGVQPPFYVPL